ncbi:rap guanine nucleotide exchange factor 3 isoform X2 [Scomber scombrus]|uniref:Rap guanine nucleotide exchange factor 3 isoform X2 n=1 Tax=Scomber scombrus TaxID=13677 RepID=A0AAV1NW69_SCOSC
MTPRRSTLDIIQAIFSMENLVKSICSPPRRRTPEIGEVSNLLLSYNTNESNFEPHTLSLNHRHTDNNVVR